MAKDLFLPGVGGRQVGGCQQSCPWRSSVFGWALGTDMPGVGETAEEAGSHSARAAGPWSIPPRVPSTHGT